MLIVNALLCWLLAGHVALDVTCHSRFVPALGALREGMPAKDVVRRLDCGPPICRASIAAGEGEGLRWPIRAADTTSVECFRLFDAVLWVGLDDTAAVTEAWFDLAPGAITLPIVRPSQGGPQSARAPGEVSACAGLLSALGLVVCLGAPAVGCVGAALGGVGLALGLVAALLSVGVAALSASGSGDTESRAALAIGYAASGPLCYLLLALLWPWAVALRHPLCVAVSACAAVGVPLYARRRMPSADGP